MRGSGRDSGVSRGRRIGDSSGRWVSRGRGAPRVDYCNGFGAMGKGSRGWVGCDRWEGIFWVREKWYMEGAPIIRMVMRRGVRVVLSKRVFIINKFYVSRCVDFMSFGVETMVSALGIRIANKDTSDGAVF